MAVLLVARLHVNTHISRRLLQDEDGDWYETGLHIFFGAYPNMMQVRSVARKTTDDTANCRPNFEQQSNCVRGFQFCSSNHRHYALRAPFLFCHNTFSSSRSSTLRTGCSGNATASSSPCRTNPASSPATTSLTSPLPSTAWQPS